MNHSQDLGAWLNRVNRAKELRSQIWMYEQVILQAQQKIRECRAALDDPGLDTRVEPARAR